MRIDWVKAFSFITLLVSGIIFDWLIKQSCLWREKQLTVLLLIRYIHT